MGKLFGKRIGSIDSKKNAIVVKNFLFCCMAVLLFFPFQQTLKGKENIRKPPKKVKAFYKAIESNDSLKVASFIKQGVDVNKHEENFMGWDDITPLMVAVNSGHMKIVQLLINAGANVNEGVDRGRSSALDLVFASRDSDMASLLIKHGADSNKLCGSVFTTLEKCVIESFHDSKAYLEEIQFLLKAGADVNGRGIGGDTPLMSASCLHNGTALVDVFISAGADVNATDGDGKSALMYACNAYDNIDQLLSLLKAGADVNIKNRKGKTALAIAKSLSDADVKYRGSSKLKHQMFIDTLIQYGAKE